MANLIQVVIGICGTLALFLTIRGYIKIGSIIGIVSQPFWIWMSVDKKLYGVLIVSVIYLIVWTYGLLKGAK